ncbi:MAG: ArsR/SmtB family transcription factor [Bacillota bacterium]
MELIRIIKALADETRLRMLNLLRQEALCVCEMEYLLDLNQSNASRHLNKLWNANIIANEKRAQWVFYRINQAVLNEHPLVRELIISELEKIDQFKQDTDKLQEYKNSGLTCEHIKQMLASKACQKD